MSMEIRMAFILTNVYIQHQCICVWQRRKSIPKPLENNNKINYKQVKKYLCVCVCWQMKMGLENIVQGCVIKIAITHKETAIYYQTKHICKYRSYLTVSKCKLIW